jgi:DNA-binding transcriptional ArsR family regulator
MVIDDVFAVIAEETRRDILSSLAAGDKAVGQLVEELGASQPTVSKHLRVLREASLVTMRAQGQKRFYSLNSGPLGQVTAWLSELADGGAQSAARFPRLFSVDEPTEDIGPEQASDTTSGGPLPSPRLPGEGGLSGNGAAPETEGAAVAARVSSAAGNDAAARLVPVAGSVPDDSRPQQLGRTVGRAANRAADLLANLPKFGRRRD